LIASFSGPPDWVSVALRNGCGIVPRADKSLPSQMTAGFFILAVIPGREANPE
jgi:hypothetical protein